MIGFYLGALLGVLLLVLFLRYVTAFRFIMGLLFAAGLLVSAFIGLLLAWPLLAWLSRTHTGWVWSGPALGAVAWCLVSWRGRLRDA